MGLEDSVDQLLWFLLAGTRGGPNRLRLLDAIGEAPANAHQLSIRLGLDYRTVCHHLRILSRNQVIANPRPDTYGSVYFLSGWLRDQPELLERVRFRLYGQSTASHPGSILAKSKAVPGQ